MPKTVTVQFQAWYYHDMEVPENWKPTKANLDALKAQAFQDADFQDGGASWEATAVEVDGDSIDLD